MMDGGMPSPLATSILFSKRFFFTYSMMQGHFSEVKIFFTQNTVGEN
jgi:hypothetical protein